MGGHGATARGGSRTPFAVRFVWGIGPTTLAALAFVCVFLVRRPGAAKPPVGLLGIILVVAGALLRGWATSVVLSKGEGTPIYPFEPARLVTAGPYRATRNPLYLAKLAVLAGIGALLRSPAIAVLAVAWGAALHAVVVPAEELWLHRHFGEEYRTYAARVPRWLRSPRWPSR